MAELFEAANMDEFNEASNKFLLDLKARGITDYNSLSWKQQKWVDDLWEKLCA